MLNVDAILWFFLVFSVVKALFFSRRSWMCFRWAFFFI